MAATGTPTPNIGLRIPLGTDPASVDDINYNSTLIDTKLGAVGNNSVQDQLNDLNSNIISKAFAQQSGSSFDTLPNGISYGSGLTNAPATGYFHILTVGTSDGRDRMQFAVQRTTATPGVYVRVKVNGTWQSWQQFTLT